MARIPTLAATTAVAVALGAGVIAPPASGSCIGPTIEPDQLTVDRGDLVTVTGIAWGDSCYDTGPPPDGRGVLGTPRDHIEVVVVQGDRTIVVAEGAADDAYGFSVEVPIPTSLEPGPARIGARLGDEPTYDLDAFGRGIELRVTDVEVPDEILAPVEFEGRTTGGPGAPADATDEQAGAPTSDVPSADRELNPWPIIGGALAALVAIGLVVFGVRRGDGGPDEPSS